ALYKDTVIVRTIDGKILSLDINSGKIRWQYQRAIPDLTLRGTSEPVIARGKIFVGLEDGRLIAISPDNGEVIWDVALSVPTGRSEIQRLVDIDGDTELYGRVLYAASFQGRVAAIDVDRGQFLWARDFSTHTGVILDEKVLYSSDDQGHIWALDRLNGATIWKQEKLAHRKLTRPTIIGDYIAVGDFEGYVHLMSRYDGHFVARYQLGQFDDLGWDLGTGIIVPPIVFRDDRLVVVTRGGIVYVLRLLKRDDEF
ncbi:MAG: PQQ-binding-like beta-propeller repeat protein, partial [Gammaproteobacteria bacterium]|nr:PQQ-binding-like beta-propeller repeat protein [Gammaproteobacteria bacterium]